MTGTLIPTDRLCHSTVCKHACTQLLGQGGIGADTQRVGKTTAAFGNMCNKAPDLWSVSEIDVVKYAYGDYALHKQVYLICLIPSVGSLSREENREAIRQVIALSGFQARTLLDEHY